MEKKKEKKPKKSKTPKPQKNPVLDWIERDLTFAALGDQLPRAFCVEETLGKIRNVLRSGRFPVLVGDSGVGKTAAIYEYITRNIADFQTKKILQLSIKQKASTLKDPGKQMGSETKHLIEYLRRHKAEVLPFFRDLHLADQFNLESQLLFLGLQFDAPLFAEGAEAAVKSMLEETSELEEYFIPIHVDEPGIDTTLKILSLWAEEKQKTEGVRFHGEVLEEAVFLTHRFLPRDRLPRKAITLLDQVGSLKTDQSNVSPKDVLDVFCAYHQFPRFLIDPAIKLDLAETERLFHSRVLGQEEAVGAIMKMVSLLKAGLSDIRRPFGVFLFVGPTGVGKTHIAQSLAEFLFEDREKVIRINMSDYPNPYGATVLFGDPTDYSLSQKRGLLTRKIMGQPFSILLLDEFEKCHPVIHDRFLQLFDEGCFINGAGENVSCRSMIVIATSNAGADIYRRNFLGFTASMDFPRIDREIDQELLRLFRFEFLNRFDQIVHFHPLKREHIRIIALRELERIKDRIGIRQRGFVIDFDESVVDWLAINGFDADYGARFLRRIMEKNVSTAIADYIVRFAPVRGTHIPLTVRNNRIIAKNAAAGPALKQKAELSLTRTYKQETILMTEANRDEIVDSLLARAGSKLALLEKRKQEASDLLQAMNEDGFWEKREGKREILERYKILDVTVSSEERLAGPIVKLAEAQAADVRPDLVAYQSLVSKAADSLYKWEERLAETGGGSVWMMISGPDPQSPDSDWILALLDLEKKWCRRLNLYATVAAYSLKDEALSRVVLEITGPGAFTYLSMEQGLHRRLNQNAKPERVRIDVVRRTLAPAADACDVKPVKKRKGLFQLEVAYALRVELAGVGIQFEALAADADVLKNLAFDLARRDKQDADSGRAARVYGENGLVKDPRTGVTAQFNKQFFKGNLEDFLDAWMASADLKEPADGE
jgi:ATP-dependent Clp protease ATP-binding subunit ClpC